jgi:hypothetical protein
MAFTVRQPLRLASTLGLVSKSAFRSTPIRSFHHAKPTANFFTSRTTTSTNALSKARNAFRQSRAYIQDPVIPNANAGILQKLVVGGAMFGGTLLAINLMFNRETREDGGMPPFERAYLNDTFMHTGLGIGIIGLSARAMFQSGFIYRLMATNPWVVMIGGIGLSIGTMMGTRATDPSK